MNLNLKKLALFSFAALLLCFAIGLLMVSLHGAHEWDGGLFLFDRDYSDSVMAWMIVVPVLFFVMLLVGAVLMMVGVMVAGVLLLVFALVVLGVGASLVPVALLFAIPALALYGTIRLIQRDRAVQPA
jgi:hypothetical protein